MIHCSTEGSQISPFRRFVPNKDWPVRLTLPYQTRRTDAH